MTEPPAAAAVFCSPLESEPLSTEKAEPVAPVLKVLHETALLDRSRRGTWVYYRVRPEVLAGLAALVGRGGVSGCTT